MEPITILTMLLDAWAKWPELRADIDRIRKGEGVSDEKWSASLAKLGKHSSDYFGSAPQPTPTPEPDSPVYDVVLQQKPDDAAYKPGDRVMRSVNPDGAYLPHPAWRVEAKDAPVIEWGGVWVLDHVVT